MLAPVKSAGNKDFRSFLTTLLLRNGNPWARRRQAGRYCCLEGWSRTAGRSVGIGVAAVVDSWQEGKKIRTHSSTTSRTNGAG